MTASSGSTRRLVLTAARRSSARRPPELLLPRITREEGRRLRDGPDAALHRVRSLSWAYQERRAHNRGTKTASSAAARSR